MGSRIQCFMVYSLHRSRWTLRRYVSSDQGGKCPGSYGYHNAQSSSIGETDDHPNQDTYCNNPPEIAKDDARWPIKCQGCDYTFKDEDARQVFGDALYERPETKEVFERRDLPPGAMWNADWYQHFYDPGPDGMWLMVQLPDGSPWCIDGRANNCGQCQQSSPLGTGHHCWTRSGVVPVITANPSISVPKYHGWLRNGWLEEC